ncbi:MAG TPA: carbonic anhydrase [Methylomirabilota bacterium]|jgi:carbonic anhydrase
MTSTHEAAATLARRDLLRMAAAGAVALGAAVTAGAGGPGTASAQTTLAPDDALRALMDGNARFRAGRLTSFQEDLTLLAQKTAEKQEPFAAVLSCADSRVPVEIVFDQTIGHVFVVRVAGNVATPEIIASLEYGAAVLGTRALMVLGHGACGAVTAAIAGKAVPGQISALYAPLRPAVDQAGPDPDATIRANARIQAGLLGKASPVLAELVAAGKLKIVAAHYDIATGAVSLLG